MTEFIGTYIYHYLVVHGACGLFGLWVELINRRELRVAHLFWAILFGPFFMLACMADFDRVLIRLPKKEAK